MALRFLTFPERLRKVKALTELLADPEIEAIARNLLSGPASMDRKLPDDIQRSPSRKAPEPSVPKRGDLIRASAEIVNSASTALTAKEVTRILEQKGFQFGAQNKQVAVSKALRSAASKGRIEPEKNGHAKAAILYRRPRTNLFHPVQEMTQ